MIESIGDYQEREAEEMRRDRRRELEARFLPQEYQMFTPGEDKDTLNQPDLLTKHIKTERPNMKVDEAFPSKYLTAADLCNSTVTVVIETMIMEEVQKGEDKKPVVYFRGKNKGLVLNKTNANTIADMHGQEMDTWGGKSISLWPTQTEFQGRAVACIRVKLGGSDGPQTSPVAQAEAFVEGVKYSNLQEINQDTNSNVVSPDDIPF